MAQLVTWFCLDTLYGKMSDIFSSMMFYSQVHNFQKLKNISLKAVNFLATKPKVTCSSETVFFSSSYSGVTAIFTAMWVILSERPIT